MRFRPLFVLGAVCAILALASCSTQTTTAVPASRNAGNTSAISYANQNVEDFAIDFDEVDEGYRVSANEEGTLSYFYYETKDYDGDEHEEEKYAIVYTPYGYDPSREYDIMYLIHGAGGDAETWLGTEDDPDEVKYCFDHLIQNGDMEPMIIVCATYYDDNEDEDTDDYDIHIINEFDQELKNDLMPAVETEYSTYAKSGAAADLIASRDHRVFGGFSMGGVTTWQLMCNSMAYARYYLPFSGMLQWSVEEQRHFGDWTGSYLANSIKAEGYTSDDFFVFAATGTEDYAIDLLEDQLQSMAKTPEMFHFGNPEDSYVNCSYGVGIGEEHDWEGRLNYVYHIMPILSAKLAG